MFVSTQYWRQVFCINTCEQSCPNLQRSFGYAIESDMHLYATIITIVKFYATNCI